jgi:NIMA (never in mitosis gene a)-related kinase 1/4/5
MEGLFRKVMKGVYPKIPANYSERLGRLIELCLQLDASKRPSARELLRLAEEGREGKEGVVAKSRASSVNLLQTIKVPKNYGSWKDELPRANYET